MSNEELIERLEMAAKTLSKWEGWCEEAGDIEDAITALKAAERKPSGPTCERSKPKVRQIMISIWTTNDPINEEPNETAGVMQNSLEDTVAFAKDAISTHWNGECDCMKEESDDD